VKLHNCGRSYCVATGCSQDRKEAQQQQPESYGACIIVANHLIFSATSCNPSGIPGLQNHQSRIPGLGKPVRDHYPFVFLLVTPQPESNHVVFITGNLRRSITPITACEVQPSITLCVEFVELAHIFVVRQFRGLLGSFVCGPGIPPL